MQRLAWLCAVVALSCSAEKFSPEKGAGGQGGVADPSVDIGTLGPGAGNKQRDAGLEALPDGSVFNSQDAGAQRDTDSDLVDGSDSGVGGAGGSGGVETGGQGGADPNCSGDECGCPEGQSVCAATCPGCFIDSECIAEGAPNPDNECEVCDPAVDAKDWAPLDGTECDDGQYCTVDDACEAGQCGGKARQCDDGVACNGVATCDEALDACSPGQSQCGADLCDVALDQCVSTCTGCLISGQCVPAGTASPSNTCLVCDPTRSSNSYSVESGKNCGQGPSECSGQDTCDAQGQCQPNHSPPGTACGDSSSSPCDAADTCNGSGQCQPNTSSNGAVCDDGQFCTTSSQCQGGQCVGSGNRNCGANQSCDEQANQCVCTGCQIGQTCVPNGAVNPSNPCQVCSVAASTTSYSANVGANCGSGPEECSKQDTCNASGVCQKNHETNGSLCTDGTCQAGVCEPDPFDCITPDPPTVVHPTLKFVSGAPPVGQGGNIRDGRYVQSRIDIYGDDVVSVNERTFEFRANYVQVGQRPTTTTGGPWIEEVQLAGTFTTSNNVISFDLERCDPLYTIDIDQLNYTATANGLVIIEQDDSGTTIVFTLTRE